MIDRVSTEIVTWQQFENKEIHPLIKRGVFFSHRDFDKVLDHYEKGKEITGLEKISDSIVFHAGAKLSNGRIVTSGGRVMAITSFGDTYKNAIKKSYQNIDQLYFDKMYYRKDIGFDL